MQRTVFATVLWLSTGFFNLAHASAPLQNAPAIPFSALQTAAFAPIPAAHRSFYLDCHGDDRNAGLSDTAAFRQLSSVNVLKLTPGDHVLLRRGCAFDGPLTAASSGTTRDPIVYTAYGDGAAPVITLNQNAEAVLASGQHLIFDGLKVATTVSAAPATSGHCRTTPVAWRVGFELTGAYNTVQRSRATGFMAGIHLSAGNNRVIGNTLTDNNVMKKNTPNVADDDSGAWGVLVNADHNEVAFNSFSGNWACSEDYGRDGASVEIYQASHNNVHHNFTTEDITFTELGGTPGTQSEFNTFSFNTYAPVRGGGAFIVLRGTKSHWGGNPGTVFDHNVGYMVDLGVICSDGCGPSILTATDNVLWQRDVPSGIAPRVCAMWADAAFTESHNVFWKTGGRPVASIDNAVLSGTDRIADPMFARASAMDFTRGTELLASVR
jgi:hypothetical protein